MTAEILKSKQLLSTALSCPWCGSMPMPSTAVVGSRDEPDRLVYLSCPTCGAKKSITVTDNQKAEASIGSISKNKRWNSYEQGCVILCLPKLLEIWNKRSKQTL